MEPVRRYLRFESYQEFDAFDAALTQQLAAGQLLALAPPAPSPFQAGQVGQPDAWYQAADTQALWVLSTPDNAWRGYFLPVAEALAQQRRASRRQRFSWGCVVLLALAGAFAAWLLAP